MHKQVSDLERFAALKALREYLFLNDPVKYNSADFIEDIPQTRPYGFFANDLLPSLAIIKHNPQERAAQIDNAAESVQGLREKGGLLPDMGRNAVNFAAGSIPISMALGGLGALFGKGRGIMPRFRNLSTFTKPNALKAVGKHMASTVGEGMAYGGLFGGMMPLATHAVHPSDEAMAEAKDILNREPYSSALPGADIMAAVNYGKNDGNNTARNLGIGAAYGAGVGAISRPLEQGIAHSGNALRSLVGMTPHQIPSLKLRSLAKPSLIGAGVGTGVGLLASLLTSNPQPQQ